MVFPEVIGRRRNIMALLQWGHVVLDVERSLVTSAPLP